MNKTVDGVVYTYIYEGDKLMRMTVGDNVTMDFIYDHNGQPFAVKYNGTMYYYVLNLQGDVVRIVNAGGTSYGVYRYDAWGKLLYATGGNLMTYNPLRYRGYVYDTETKLYYCQSRYYDPEVGRFINADSFASTGQGVLGHNMFAYCGNNPVNNVDPSGRFYIDWDLLPNQQAGEAFGKRLVELTEKDEELIKSGKVSYKSRGSGNGAHIKNSHKIKTPWVMSDFIEENRSDDITGTTTGVVYEWVFHNAAHKIGSVFGLDSISDPAAHLDVGKTIFDDQRPPFTLKWLMSEGMKWTYCLVFPEDAKHDFLSWILGGP